MTKSKRAMYKRGRVDAAKAQATNAEWCLREGARSMRRGYLHAAATHAARALEHLANGFVMLKKKGNDDE